MSSNCTYYVVLNLKNASTTMRHLEVTCVPKHWIVKNIMYFPTNKTAFVIDAMVRCGSYGDQVNTKSWKKFVCIVKHKFSSYDEAQRYIDISFDGDESSTDGAPLDQLCKMQKEINSTSTRSQ